MDCKNCKNCNSPMPSRGGFVVLENELANGIGLAVIKADGLDPDAAGDHICGLMCLNVHTSKKFSEMAGVKPMFPSRAAA